MGGVAALINGLAYLGLMLGVAGVLMLAPPLAEPGAAVFGLAFIVWLLWAGVVLVGSYALPVESRLIRFALKHLERIFNVKNY